MVEARLPTGLWVEIHLKNLEASGKYYYFLQKGNHASGLVMLKLNGLKGKVVLLQQERNFESGALEWVHPFEHPQIDEFQADEAIRRAIARDPDLWAIEIEDPDMQNPFID